MKQNEISSVAIYPPIGIARIGNSSDYFLASEVPGVEPKPRGGYKDAEGRVKKQAVRFRVYAFNSAEEVLGEVTANDAVIEWRIQVANIKAAWYQFNNALDLPGSSIPAAPRNKNVTGKNRENLAITPTPVSITGRNQADDKYYFDDGQFYDKKVNLGHVQTDGEGRLLFFPGNGDAESHHNIPAITFANNDGWHDDTCDGVIRAKVTIGATEFEAKPAMVAVTPPNFGPGLFGVVTMNDVVQNLFIQEMGYPNPSAGGVEFWRDIFPILKRMTETQWVNQGFFMLFGKNSPSDFTNPKLIEILKNNSESSKEARTRVFNWFRDPNSMEYTPVKVPPFYGDGFGEYVKSALDDLPITAIQWGRLEKWAKGNFIVGTSIKPMAFEDLDLQGQITALNQAPLEECLGGPFHPGIELTWPMRVAEMWKTPYRLKVVEEGTPTKLDFGPLLSPAIALGKDGPLSVSGPGSLTRWLGVPWQTDEASCLSGYDTSLYLPLPSFWAARVPNQVLSEQSYLRMEDERVNIAQRLKHFDYRQDWLRDFGSVYKKKINLMISEWHELGIIVKIEEDVPNNAEGYLPNIVWKETDRHFSAGDPTFEQVIYAEKEEIPSLEVVKESELLRIGGIIPKRIRERRTFKRDER